MAPRKTVLVADDDDDLFELVLTALGDHHRVIRAKDGTEALAEVRAERPDLVLLDLDMPPRGGWAVLSELRRDPTTRAIRVAIFSSLSIEGFKKMAGEMGAVGFVEKPFTIEGLSSRVAELLRGQESPGGS